MTPTDWRALCAELLDEVAARPLLLDRELIDRARAALAAEPAVPEGEPPGWCESDAEQRAWQAGWEARDDVMMRPLAPPAQGELAELLEELRRICFDVAPCDADTIRRAADLLEQRHPTHVPAPDPTDEQLLATVDAVSVTLPPLPRDHTDAHGRIEYDIAWRVAMARAVLARWGGQVAPVQERCGHD